jgi:hypothetical protein
LRRFPGGKHTPGGLSQLRIRATLRGARLPVSSRIVTAAVFALALVGVAIAVGVGAVPMTSTVAQTTDAARLAPSQQSQLSLSESSAVMATFAPHIAIDTPMPSSSVKKTPAKPKPSVSPSTASATPTPSASTSPTQAPTPTGTASSGLTPVALPGNVTPKGENQLAWSEAILAALGAPDTDANIISMGYWMQNEAGGLVGENNPINVSEQGYDGWNIQSEGSGWYLRSYPTVADGVAAIAAYLSYPNYSQIKSDLQAGIGLGTSTSTLASQLSVYSGGGYTTIPDSWGSSQGEPET